MSHLPDFGSNNSIPSAFYEKKFFESIWLQVSSNGSSKLVKTFIKTTCFAILNYHYGFKKKTPKFLFLVKLHHFVEHYEARKGEGPIWSKNWDITA